MSRKAKVKGQRRAKRRARKYAAVINDAEAVVGYDIVHYVVLLFIK